LREPRFTAAREHRTGEKRPITWLRTREEFYRIQSIIYSAEDSAPASGSREHGMRKAAEAKTSSSSSFSAWQSAQKEKHDDNQSKQPFCERVAQEPASQSGPHRVAPLYDFADA
jgi:hypothetical protein